MNDTDLEKLKAKREQLREKDKAIGKKLRREYGVRLAKARKDDARQKILIGAMVLDRVKQGLQDEGELKRLLDAFLVRDRERALFGLPPLPPPPAPHPEPSLTVEAYDAGKA